MMSILILKKFTLQFEARNLFRLKRIIINSTSKCTAKYLIFFDTDKKQPVYRLWKSLTKIKIITGKSRNHIVWQSVWYSNTCLRLSLFFVIVCLTINATNNADNNNDNLNNNNESVLHTHTHTQMTTHKIRKQTKKKYVFIDHICEMQQY